MNYLQTTILPSYAAGIDAGAGTVMVDSGSINGVPATSSHYLLTDVLRDQLRFQGVVISDYQDVTALQTAYHIAPDLPGAIAAAVNAGVDMSMQVSDPAGWQTAILQAVNTGKISRARIDQAVAPHPHAEVPARPVRPAVRGRPGETVRRRERRQRRGHRGPRPDARRPRRSRSPCCATRTTRCRLPPARRSW